MMFAKLKRKYKNEFPRISPMIRSLFSAFLVLAAASAAKAHFLFVVPESDATHAKVILSETLQPDDDIEPKIVAGAKLVVTGADGRDIALELTPGEHAYTTAIAGSGMRVVHGVAELGVQQRGNSKPHLLT